MGKKLLIKLNKSKVKLIVEFLLSTFSDESTTKFLQKPKYIGNSLFFVNDLTQALRDNKFDSDHWIFDFNIIAEPSNNVIQSYFSNFIHLDLNLHIYALTANGNKNTLFEVYKTHPSANLTISQVCTVDRNLNKADQISTDYIRKRGNNLNGVRLKVGFIAASPLVSGKNEVNNIV